MNNYIREIEEIAEKCSCSQSDGYAQIMRICEEMKKKSIINLFKRREELVIIDDILPIFTNGCKFKQISFWKNKCRYSTLVFNYSELPQIGEVIPYSQLEKFKVPLETLEELKRW